MFEKKFGNTFRHVVTIIAREHKGRFETVNMQVQYVYPVVEVGLENEVVLKCSE